MFRSSVPSRSAVQPSALSVIRRSSSSARCGDRLGERERERVGLALVERRQRLAGQIPLVEEEQRRPARLPPPDGHESSSSIETSTASTSRPVEPPSAAATLRLHLAGEPGQHGAVPSRELELHPDVAVGDRDVEPAPRPAHADAVDALRLRRRREPASASPSIRIVPRGPRITCPSRLIRPAPAGAPPSRRGSSSSSRRCANSGEREDVEREAPRRRDALQLELLERPDGRARSRAGRSSAQTISFAISES